MSKFKLILKELNNNNIKYIIKYEQSFNIKINKNINIFIFNRDLFKDKKYNIIIYKNNKKPVYFTTNKLNIFISRLKLILKILK